MKILFQGDSITDAGRGREDYHLLGNGYPAFAAKLIEGHYKDKEIEFVNLGISGNQTKDLVERLQEDFIDIQPDIVSILIGVNDTWHHAADKSWVSKELFEANYRRVLEELKSKTNAKIIMLEPFLLYTEDKEFFYEDLYSKILVVRKLAREFADEFIPLDGLFAAASIKKTPTDFASDGVHPTEEGAKFIAGKYFAAVKNILG